ncbi:MAG: FAD-dependent oxidoreductase [Lachnospiraceae bacterium]|nr:FAD-dependent oxidoreductase [Lachnospiraceae bacterium]
MGNTYLEQARELPIYDECDVLVVGGGAAGHSAAIAAARAGNKNIILMERYGYCGGDVTGGYVIMVPNLSWYNKQFVRGLQEEWFQRLKKIPNAVRGPEGEELGSTDPLLIDSWSAIHDCVSRGGFEGAKPSCLVRAVYYEPNQLKIEMDKMLLEHKDSIKVIYHSWGVRPIVDDDVITGVIFESKEGRKVIKAKVVIDATGDGDIFSQTGAPFASLADAETRSSTTALVWRIGGVNYDLFDEWKRVHPTQMAALRECLSKKAGFRSMVLPSNQNDIVWVNNWHADRDCSNVADITFTEMQTRDTMRDVLEYLRATIPVAFRDAYIYDIAPQLGARCSRRLKGEYIMTMKDFALGLKHEDVIAWHSTICQLNDCGPVEIPYRAILPQKTENMLCPGRHISADDVAIDWLTLIPQCVGTGQAAGVAAAVAIADGTTTHDVNIKKVQDILVSQDVPLPRRDDVDPSYTELCEEHEYGLYTAMAKKAKAEADISSFRQW